LNQSATTAEPAASTARPASAAPTMKAAAPGPAHHAVVEAAARPRAGGGADRQRVRQRPSGPVAACWAKPTSRSNAAEPAGTSP
jgi:hypothetical protein